MSSFPRPQKGDIVWCYFPNRESVNIPTAKSRPSLIISVSDELGDEDVWVKVSYGTGQRTSSKGGTVEEYEFEIDGDTDNQTNLKEETKFDLLRLATLKYTSVWFEVKNGCKTPKLGSLNNQSRQKIKKPYAVAKNIQKQRQSDEKSPN